MIRIDGHRTDTFWRVNINNKALLTDEGGFAVALKNGTGAASVRGEIVEASTIPMTIEGTTAGDATPIGAFFKSGVAVGANAWITVAGIGPARSDTGGFNPGDWIETSDNQNQRAGGGSHSPNAVRHFDEIGHAITQASSNGTNLINFHFN